MELFPVWGRLTSALGRIRTSTGLRVNGVNVQHIAVFVGQRNFASFLRVVRLISAFARYDASLFLVIVNCPAAKILVCNVGQRL